MACKGSAVRTRSAPDYLICICSNCYMSVKFNNTIKAAIGEELAAWYRQYGHVTARRPYQDGDNGSGDATAQPIFESHPLLSELPIGASSDLAFVDNNNPRCTEEAEQRSDELSNQPRQRLEMRLGNQHKKKYIYEMFTKPTGY